MAEVHKRATGGCGTLLKVVQIQVGPMANFAYLAVDERTKEGMVVDSGWEVAPILEATRREEAKVKFAVATHQHFDHVSTLGDLAEKLGAKVVAYEGSPVEADIAVKDGEALKVGDMAVKVLHTPGHTPDSICLFDGGSVFTGDTLFVGTIGRFEKEDRERMFDSIHETILKLPPETMMYPGHDYGEVSRRTLADEAVANPFLRLDRKAFLSLAG